MTQANNTELEKLKYRLNLILIAGLCSTTLAPSVLFFFTGEGEFTWLILFICIGYGISRIPKSFYSHFQLSNDLKVYKKLGVDTFKRFSTNGDLINRRIRKTHPTYRNVINAEGIKEKIDETFIVEKSHIVLFVFCLLTNIYAFWTNSLIIGLILFIGNILFNLYPTLLQQYNRLRYKKIIERFALST